jgi:hypothetical protein
MSGILLFGLEMVVQFSSPRNWVFEKCPDLHLQTEYWFFDQKENG